MEKTSDSPPELKRSFKAKKQITEMPRSQSDHYLNQSQNSQKASLISSVASGQGLKILNRSKRAYYKSRLRIIALIYIFAGLLYLIYSIVFLVVYSDHNIFEQYEQNTEFNYALLTTNYSLEAFDSVLIIALGVFACKVFNNIMDPCLVKALNWAAKTEFIISTCLSFAIFSVH